MAHMSVFSHVQLYTIAAHAYQANENTLDYVH